MSERVEYGVRCNRETFWPKWNNWIAWSRVGRWALAHWLAWSSDPFGEMYDCGKHRVIKRTITEEAIP